MSRHDGRLLLMVADGIPSRSLLFSRAIVEPDDRNMNVRSIYDPIPVADCKEDVARGLDSFQTSAGLLPPRIP